MSARISPYSSAPIPQSERLQELVIYMKVTNASALQAKIARLPLRIPQCRGTARGGIAMYWRNDESDEHFQEIIESAVYYYYIALL